MDALEQITAEMDKADCSRTMPSPMLYEMEKNSCRETAATQLGHVIEVLEKKLIALQMLRKIVSQVDVGSTMEDLLRDLIARIGRMA
jgi:hypothetical protein